MYEPLRLSLADEAATLAAGRELAAGFLRLQPAILRAWLHGDLGAGKTTWVRGFLAGLGHSGRVPSPTYPLIESYACGTYTVYHLDLYRITHPMEFTELDVEEFLRPHTVLLVEWPERAQDLLPEADFRIQLEFDHSARSLILQPLSTMGESILQSLAPHFAR